MSETTVTEQWADFIHGLTFADLPPEVVTRTRIAVTDYLGCLLAGVPSDSGRKMLDYLRDFGAKGECSVPGTTLRLAPADAALANGTLGHALDYDDVTFQMIGHPGVSILPSVLALGEWADASIHDAVVAYVIGYEAATRLGMLMNLRHYESGWHATGTLGTLGAAFGAAKILGLQPSAVVSTIGLASSMAAGIRQNFGTDTKPFHAGRAAQNGTTAALLASRDYTSATNALDGQWGFVNVYTSSNDRDPQELVKDLGLTWNIVNPGFATKIYPSCASTHTAIDSALDLLHEHGPLDPSEIESVRIGVVRLTPKILIHHNPRTGLEAKFSMEYCLARALVSGGVIMSHFSDVAVHEPKVRQVMDRITMFVEPQIDAAWKTSEPRPARLEVILRSGRTIRSGADLPRGAPGRPVDSKALLAKYRDCAGIVFDSATVDSTLAKVSKLGEGDMPVRELMRVFRAVGRD